MNQKYDVMVIGPVSLDHNIDYEGNERNEIGGAVVASGFAAAGSGAKTAIFCKFNSKDLTVSGCFGESGQIFTRRVCAYLCYKKSVFYSR